MLGIVLLHEVGQDGIRFPNQEPNDGEISMWFITAEIVAANTDQIAKLPAVWSIRVGIRPLGLNLVCSAALCSPFWKSR